MRVCALHALRRRLDRVACVARRAEYAAPCMRASTSRALAALLAMHVAAGLDRHYVWYALPADETQLAHAALGTPTCRCRQCACGTCSCTRLIS